MAELAHIIEFISIDVVFIGLVVSLIGVLTVGIWKCRRDGVFQGLLEGSRIAKCLLESKDKKSLIVLAIGLVLASQLGIVFERLADEILDSQEVIESGLFLYFPEFDKIYRGKLSGKWKEEDLLKLAAIKDAFKRADFAPKIKELLSRHLPPKDGSCCKPKDKKDDCAKGFFQHANAVVIGEHGSESQRDELRHEKYIVRLLSVSFVGTWILIIAIFFGPFVSAGYSAIWSQHCKEGLLRLRAAVVFLLLFWVVEGAILRLWTEQSIRHNRRLVHAYIAIASYGDPAMDIPVVESVMQGSSEM